MKTGLRFAFSFTIVTLMLFLPMFKAGGTAFQTQSVSIDPVSGPAGAGVTVWANGFHENDTAYIYWDKMDIDHLVGSIATDGKGNGTGSFYVPSNAGAWVHTVYVCTYCTKPDEKQATTQFEVIGKETDTPLPEPTLTNTPPGGPSLTPTKTPFGGKTGPSVTPSPGSLIPVLGAEIFYVPPSYPYIPRFQDHRCTSLGLGTDAVRIGFDDLGSSTSLGTQYGSQGVQFVSGTALVGAPPMGAHSPGNAVRSLVSEFGGPVTIRFTAPVSAVGVFVGREWPEGGEVVFASMSAYTGSMARVGSDQVQLPERESAFEDCLVVRAPAGGRIDTVSINYTTATGASVVESRWFDDLTFIPMSTPARDIRPTVDITTPPDGSRQMGTGLTMVARYWEDVRLARVTMTVNGGAAREISFGPVGGENPYHYVSTVPLTGLIENAENSITVTATDSIGQTGSDTTTFYFAGRAGDIWVTGIEVVQSIQTDTNTIPLIGNKTTLVRVYVQAQEDARGPWNDVTALLTVRGSAGTGTYTPANVSGRTVSSGGRTFRVITVPTAGSTRQNLESGFYFLLNRADTVTGTRDFEVDIFSVSGRPEADTGNNHETTSLGFIGPTSLTIYGVAYLYQPTGASQVYEDGHWVYHIAQPDFSQFEAHRQVVEAMLPLSSFTILPYPGMVTAPATIVSDGLPPTFGPPYFSSLAAARTWAEGLLRGRSGSTIIYLLEPTDTCGCGEALRLGGTSNTRINGQNNRSHNGVGRVMAHELGHAMGMWWHIVSPPEHTAYEPWNTDYPHGSSSIGPQVGVNLAAPNAPEVMYYDGGHDMHALMSYDWPQWVSPYEYCLVMDSLGTTWPCPESARTASLPGASGLIAQASAHTATSVSAEERPSLYVSGWISRDGMTGRFDPFQTSLSREDPEAPLLSGTYQIVLEDAGGKVLSSYPFDLINSGTDDKEEYRFTINVPVEPMPAKILLRQGELVLAEQRAGGSIPGVGLLTPAGGEEWTGVQTISWDGKGLAPLYSVEYSGDGGQTWITLAAGLTETSLQVDFDAMPGSEQAQVRVIASDGFHYAVAQTAAPFRVPEKSPTVAVSSPAEGETFIGGLPVIARVSGYDWEDGALTDENTRWSSDLDGELGNGLWVMMPNLSVGEHVLTATVTDADGNASIASVHITIIAPDVEEIAPYESRSAIAWILFAGIGALALAGAVVVLIVLKRKRTAGRKGREAA